MLSLRALVRDTGGAPAASPETEDCAAEESILPGLKREDSGARISGANTKRSTSDGIRQWAV
jgi:hypothetical protein